MTVSTLTVAPELNRSGAAPCAEPSFTHLTILSRSTDVRLQALARAARADYPQWLAHVKPAAGCTRPIRLAGQMLTVEAATGRLLSTIDTADMPDGVIYKPCGNRRASVCPACSKVYQRDAYQVFRTGLVGGKGVPETVAGHPAVFATFTAPSFGEVHTRVVRRHSCKQRRLCDCRAEPCQPRRDATVCPHGTVLACYVRHEDTDRRLGTPLCLDCYDHDGQVVWNLASGELWRRTRIGIERFIRHRAQAVGVDPETVKVTYGKAAEMQRRAVIHFHAIIRLDGTQPGNRGATLDPSAQLGALDLVDAVEYAAGATAFTTKPHPIRPAGWRIGWGAQLDVRVIKVGADGEITDGMVAAYLAKYATKSTEATGHVSTRLSDETVNLYADPDGSHTERLVEACWMLGQPREWRRLRRWAHMLGFGGHYATKSHDFGVTFSYIRNQRVVFRRATRTGPETDDQVPEQETTLVVNFLQFVGAGWHTIGDALLANDSAARAREHQRVAREQIAGLAA
jgi:hypothetical protein